MPQEENGEKNTVQELSYETGEGNSGYIYITDKALSHDEKRPLILVMTYTTGNARAVVKGCGWDTLAEKENLILVSPEYNNYATYSETGRLRQDVEYAVSHYPVDTSRIYATGFSNGGAASVAMVSCYPDLFAAISAMGWMVDMQGQDSSYDIPFQVIQGTEEYTQKIEGSPAVMDDERNAIRSLLLYDEMITSETKEDYGKTPYWGYEPDKISEGASGNDSWTVGDYFKDDRDIPYAQLVLVDGARHEMHPWEAGMAWNFLKDYQRAGKDVEITDSLLNKGDSSQTDEEQILALYKTMQDAMINKDTDYLKSIMPDHVTHITGKVQSIDEWLDDVENERMKYYSIKIANPAVTVNGNTATLSCTNIIDARIYGSRGPWSLQGTGNFIRDAEGWHFL